MDEATEILARPETGSPAIAAETEAIELLLQSKRINPKGGGGGGSSPGGGGERHDQDSALALLGGGAEREGGAGRPRRLAGDRRVGAVAARGVPHGPGRVFQPARTRPGRTLRPVRKRLLGGLGSRLRDLSQASPAGGFGSSQ